MHTFEIGDRVGWAQYWCLGKPRGTVTSLIARPRPGIATGECIEVRWDDLDNDTPEWPPNLMRYEQ